jgi:hypothetical protein
MHLTLRHFFVLCLTTLSVVACGSGSTTSGSPTTGGESSIDRSKPIATQFISFFDKLKPNSSFAGLKIKKASHPAKFVGSWSTWRNRRSNFRTLNADGSCEEKSYLHYTSTEDILDCRQWYHITLDNNDSLLFFIYGNGDNSIEKYEFNDSNNITITHYASGYSHLMTRTTSNPIAENYILRPLIGTWREVNYSDKYQSLHWVFDVNRTFTLKDIDLETNQKTFEEKGTWNLSNGTLSINTASETVPKTLKLDFIYNDKIIAFNEGLDYRRKNFRRYQEPLMITGDPFIGRFHNTHHFIYSNVAMTLIIRKNSANYKVNIVWNGTLYKDLVAKVSDDRLHINTHIGVIHLKPILGGVKIESMTYPDGTTDKSTFDFEWDLLRVAQSPVTTPTPQIIGKWVQESEERAFPGVTKYTFYNDNTFYFETATNSIDISKTEEGIYRVENNNKIYFKGYCQKEETFQSFKLNTEQFSIKIPHGFNNARYETHFIKIPQSESLSKFDQAQKRFKHDGIVPVVPHPKKKGKYVFSKKHSYKWILTDVISGGPSSSMSYNFNPDGKMTAIYIVAGSPAYTAREYYIEAKVGKAEKIIMTDRDGKQEITPLYESRTKLCPSNYIELELTKK